MKRKRHLEEEHHHQSSSDHSTISPDDQPERRLPSPITSGTKDDQHQSEDAVLMEFLDYTTHGWTGVLSVQLFRIFMCSGGVAKLQHDIQTDLKRKGPSCLSRMHDLLNLSDVSLLRTILFSLNNIVEKLHQISYTRMTTEDGLMRKLSSTQQSPYQKLRFEDFTTFKTSAEACRHHQRHNNRVFIDDELCRYLMATRDRRYIKLHPSRTLYTQLLDTSTVQHMSETELKRRPEITEKTHVIYDSFMKISVYDPKTGKEHEERLMVMFPIIRTVQFPVVPYASRSSVGGRFSLVSLQMYLLERLNEHVHPNRCNVMEQMYKLQMLIREKRHTVMGNRHVNDMSQDDVEMLGHLDRCLNVAVQVTALMILYYIDTGNTLIHNTIVGQYSEHWVAVVALERLGLSASLDSTSDALAWFKCIFSLVDPLSEDHQSDDYGDWDPLKIPWEYISTLRRYFQQRIYCSYIDQSDDHDYSFRNNLLHEGHRYLMYMKHQCPRERMECVDLWTGSVLNLRSLANVINPPSNSAAAAAPPPLNQSQ